MADAPIDPPDGWETPPPFEAGGRRWHRYRHRPTENVVVEVRLGEAVAGDESDRFDLLVSMRLADRGPVTHDFRVASYDELADATRATESLLDRLASEVFDTDPVARVQNVLADLVDAPGDRGVLARLYRAVFGR